MLQPIIKLAGITLLITSTWAGSVSAQAVPSPKRALIRELLELTQAGESANAILSQSLAQMEAELPKLLSGFLKDSGLQGDALEKQTNDTALRIIQRYRERVPKVLDMKQITEQISYSLYEKFYTEAELKDVIAFYKTPTGQKVITTTPRLMSESIRLSNQLVLPKMTNLIQEIVKEEIGRLPAKSK
ncbi:DUF2059 domain-containing protein [Phormidium sp. CLA17]|uniref:DUF2059 domain-containing protein n=1 Tax=Leptolyngbya sp. Cla-17 TaxID=2803751 RepID=UPI00149176DB|nr:DUF2059 domain-containing protein [Leptolyngbya sp. Cla-17]MBM0740814.1 DUF2059 domain-containing protein [Leptolyngbya sp. Cla-17]